MQNESKTPRVVVTGIGVISPIGNDKQTFWESLVAGKCGIGTVTRFDTTDYACKVAGEVKDFSIDGYMDPKEAKRNDRYARYAVVAAKKAMEDAGLKVGDRTVVGKEFGHRGHGND